MKDGLLEMRKVFVYYNLHQHMWSVKDIKTGRVICHQYEVQLYNATFKVSAAGRARVLKERRKNVHAGVQGYMTPDRTRTYNLLIRSQMLYPLSYRCILVYRLYYTRTLA